MIFSRRHTIELHDERGQTMAEYGLMLALVTLATVSAFSLLGSDVSALLGRIAGFIGG